MKNFVIFILTIHFLCMPVLAFDLDTSVDDQIRKNYNPTKLDDDVALPALPKILNESDFKEDTKPVNIISPQPLKQAKITSSVPKASSTPHEFALLKKGTRIQLKLLNSVSEKSQRGTKLTFVSIYPVSTTYFTIPMGTIFKGNVLDSHSPQLSGNGGLIVININSMIINGEVQPINASVIKANSKMIFLNNIKGQREYIDSVFKSMRPGCHYLGKMFNVAGRLASDGSTIILSPFSIALGVLVLGGNILVSPVCGLFYKGRSIYIKEGSVVEIKVLQDAYFYN